MSSTALDVEAASARKNNQYDDLEVDNESNFGMSVIDAPKHYPGLGGTGSTIGFKESEIRVPNTDD